MKQGEALSILKMGYNVFITGSPGSGKTFLLNKYIDYLKKHKKNVAITASTGVAAAHMDGTTLHSWAGIKIKESFSKKDIDKIVANPYIVDKISKTDVLIIDEVSMLKIEQFDAVNEICQLVRENFTSFGGIQLVCSGDFFQLPPVEKNRKNTNFVLESNAWKFSDMKVCYLDEQHRHKDKNLCKILDYIRNNLAEKSKALLLEKIKIARIFHDPPMKLYTHNIDVDFINNHELAKIKTEGFIYYMASTGPKVVVSALKKNCLAPEKLILKIGAKVMFLKNNFDAGYVNGTQGKITGFNEQKMPIVETNSGKRIAVGYADWTREEDDLVIAKITQLPLRLAWAITVHKSQGMNLDTAEINLSKCFIEGMGYVAISRIRSLDGLNLMGINDMAFCVNKKIIEIDKDLKNISKKLRDNFNKISLEKKRKKQKEFLNQKTNSASLF
jgi:ATP-dependent exoDNAse (exonuclease V) alpha subunit